MSDRDLSARMIAFYGAIAGGVTIQASNIPTGATGVFVITALSVSAATVVNADLKGVLKFAGATVLEFAGGTMTPLNLAYNVNGGNINLTGAGTSTTPNGTIVGYWR